MLKSLAQSGRLSTLIHPEAVSGIHVRRKRCHETELLEILWITPMYAKLYKHFLAMCSKLKSA
jgi:hypothetical protein